MSSKDQNSLARWTSFGSLAVAIISLILSCVVYFSSVEDRQLTRLLESRQLLDDAFDIMGGKQGTTVIMMDLKPPTEKDIRSFEQARRKIEKALELTPDYYMAYEYYGLYLERVGKLDEAFEAMERSTKLTTDDGWPWNDLANLHRRRGNYTKSFQSIYRAIEIDPSNPQFFRNLGLYHLDQNDKEAARSNFLKAVELARPRGITMIFPPPFKHLNTTQQNDTAKY